MKSWLPICLALLFILVACDPAPTPSSAGEQASRLPNPSQDAFDLLYNSEPDIIRAADQCPKSSDETLSAFTKRVMTEFATPTICAESKDGISETGHPYGTKTIVFPNVVMTIETDEIDGILQTLDIKPDAQLTRSWFDSRRADFANGYDQYMDWETDSDPSDLVDTYWAPELINTQVQLTLREDGTIAQIRFSDPN